MSPIRRRSLPERLPNRPLPPRRLSDMTRKTVSLAITMAAIAALSGCASMSPKYSQPAPPVPASWPSGPAYQGTAAQGPAMADLAWQEFFVDANLRKVIALALNNNRDLRVAALNIEQ